MTDHGAALRGTVHGRVIELERDPGLPDGQAVTVMVAPQYATIVPPEPIPEDIPRAELWLDRLVFDSSILPGVRIVKGTKLTAESLVTEIERGASDEALLLAHPGLTPEDVQAIRVYACVPPWIRRTAGAWAEHAEDVDEFVEWTYEQRENDRRPVES